MRYRGFGGMKSKLINLSNRPYLLIAALGLSLVLYILGLTFLFIPLLLIVVSLGVPFPRVFSSLFSKVILSSLLFYGLFQLLSSILLFIWPEANYFKVIAIVITIATAGIIFASRNSTAVPSTLFGRTDFFAMLAVSIFLIPIVLLCFSKNGVTHIASIGGIQGVDGVNHIAYLADISQDKKLDYEKGRYYPAGFHLVTSFAQDSFTIKQGDMRWEASARLFIIQYLISAFVLVYVAFLFVKQLTSDVLRYRANNFVLAISLGVPLTLFYLIPFFYNAFLSHYYIIASTIACYIYLTEYTLIKNKTKFRKSDVLLFKGNMTILFGALLLIYGASSSWPLFAPYSRQTHITLKMSCLL
jgi:hypothetical protein